MNRLALESFLSPLVDLASSPDPESAGDKTTSQSLLNDDRWLLIERRGEKVALPCVVSGRVGEYAGLLPSEVTDLRLSFLKPLTMLSEDCRDLPGFPCSGFSVVCSDAGSVVG